jgi:hypothetical protein
LEKLQEIVEDIAKNQTLMMNRIINLERAQQQAPRPPFKGQQIYCGKTPNGGKNSTTFLR